MATSPKTVHPDSKGRVALGKFAEGVSSFRIHKEANGLLVLEPYAEVPFREIWLHRNPEAMGMVQHGLRESAEGKVKSLGDFSHFADDELDGK